jgi:hypothetical protein
MTGNRGCWAGAALLATFALGPLLRETYAPGNSSTEGCRLRTSLRRRRRLDHITGHQYYALRPVLIKNHQI